MAPSPPLRVQRHPHSPFVLVSRYRPQSQPPLLDDLKRDPDSRLSLCCWLSIPYFLSLFLSIPSLSQSIFEPLSQPAPGNIHNPLLDCASHLPYTFLPPSCSPLSNTCSMKEASSDPDIASKRSDAQPVANGLSHQPDTELRDLSPSFLNEHAPPAASAATSPNTLQTPENHNAGALSLLSNDAPFIVNKIPDKDFLKSSLKSKKRSTAPVPQDERPGSFVGTKEAHESTFNPETTANSDDGIENEEDGQNQKKRTFTQEFRRSFWLVMTHSWFNVLLVFVPLGIILANINGINSGIVFAMNCIAVIPLAGLLAFATESVASKMGDALGALLNVTFGNAVELIIFIIALVKNEIRIVQASLLGSILANLLLILGMGFFLGGLRFREQVYNSTVTQMSACLLSLSVISLVLPVCSISLTMPFFKPTANSFLDGFPRIIQRCKLGGPPVTQD